MIQLLEFELFLFDLDDTLTQTRFSYYSAQEAAIREVFSCRSEREVTEYVGITKWLCRKIGSGNPDLYFTAFLREINFPDDKSDQTLNDLMSSYFHHYWRLFSLLPHALEFLGLLTSTGKKLALVSNGKIETQGKKLKHCALESYFDEEARFISGNYDPELAKPSPYMVLEACRHFKMDVSKAVFFGNALIDILAGKLAGVTTVLIGDLPENEERPMISKPDFQIHGWKSLVS